MRFRQAPAVLALPASCLLLAYALTLWADSRMNAAFSGHWHDLQQHLRTALKGPRRRAIETAAAAALPDTPLAVGTHALAALPEIIPSSEHPRKS